MSMVHFQVHHGAESDISFPWLGELRVISTEGETYTALAHIADQLPVVVYTGECLLIGRGEGERGEESHHDLTNSLKMCDMNSPCLSRDIN